MASSRIRVRLRRVVRKHRRNFFQRDHISETKKKGKRGEQRRAKKKKSNRSLSTDVIEIQNEERIPGNFYYFFGKNVLYAIFFFLRK